MAKRNDRDMSIVKLIYAIMSRGEWWTIPELRARLAMHGRVALDTSISARIRDLRKAPWNRTVNRRVRAGHEHLEEYSLMTGNAQSHNSAA